MKVVYNSIIESVLNAQRVAEENGRTIKHIELFESEYREALGEVGLPYREPSDGDIFFGIKIVVLTKERLRERAEQKSGILKD